MFVCSPTWRNDPIQLVFCNCIETILVCWTGEFDNSASQHATSWKDGDFDKETFSPDDLMFWGWGKMK